MTENFKTLQELFNEYPWRTLSKFTPLAKRYGFTDIKEIKEFLKKQAVHDMKVKTTDKMLPIYSNEGGEYHFDTMVCKKCYFLVLININTRKAYAYYMNSKGANEVRLAFDKFFRDIESENKTVNILRSDQDSAYLSKSFTDYLFNKDVEYFTTEDNNHNILGIINRFMRTLRDLNSRNEFSEGRMKKLIFEYNSSPHKALGGISPNDFTEEDEVRYISDKSTATDIIKQRINLKEGDHVRVVLDKKIIGKNRSNLSNEAYVIDSKEGNSFIIRAKDGSIDKYSAYRLVKCDDRYPIAETIKKGKRGIIEEILEYDVKKDKYKVRYDEGTVDYIPSKHLRETNPLKLSAMEREYWSQQDDVPKNIRKYMIREIVEESNEH